MSFITSSGVSSSPRIGLFALHLAEYFFIVSRPTQAKRFYKYNRSCQLSFRNFRAKLIETSSKQLVSGRLMKLCRLDAAESNCRHVSRFPENGKEDERFVGL